MVSSLDLPDVPFSVLKLSPSWSPKYILSRFPNCLSAVILRLYSIMEGNENRTAQTPAFKDGVRVFLFWPMHHGPWFREAAPASRA